MITGHILRRPTRSPKARVQSERCSGVFLPLVCWTSQHSILCSAACSVLSWEQNPAEWLAMCPCSVSRSFCFSSFGAAFIPPPSHYTWHMHPEHSSEPHSIPRCWSHSRVVWRLIGIETCVISCSHFHLDVKWAQWRSGSRLWLAAGSRRRYECASELALTFHSPSGCLLVCFHTCSLFSVPGSICAERLGCENGWKWSGVRLK